MLLLEGSTNVLVYVNQGSVECVLSIVSFSLYWLKRRRGLGCLCFCILSVLDVGDVEGSTLSVAACIAGHVGVLCVCVWDTRSAPLLLELANEKAAAAFIDLGIEISGSPGAVRKSYWA